MDVTKFALSTEEAEILMLFAECKDVQVVSAKIGRDPSGVSRALKRLAEKFPVIEKRAGRWEMTSMGIELNALNKNFAHAQGNLLSNVSNLRIGTNREFATRIVAPQLNELETLARNTRIDLLSFEAGVEHALKTGLIDIGFDCGRPNDPLIGYKLLASEPVSVFSSKTFFKQHKREVDAGNWHNIPHILCERLPPDRIMKIAEPSWKIASHVNDIAAARELAQIHMGWALLPDYAVKREVDSGTLIKIGPEFDFEKYGIWWLRQRKHLTPLVDRFSDWLKKVELR